MEDKKDRVALGNLSINKTSTRVTNRSGTSNKKAGIKPPVKRAAVQKDVAKCKIGFLDLPREIRDLVYFYYIRNKCSCCNNNVGVTVTKSMPAVISLQQIEPAFTRTCQLVRNELLPLFYANTKFNFTIIDWHLVCVLTEWRKMICDDYAKSIKKFGFVLEGNTGWSNAATFLKYMEENFAPGCEFHFSGESPKMCSAFQRSCEVGKSLRDHGVKWSEVREDLDRISHCIYASGWDGTWQCYWDDEDFLESELDEDDEDDAEEEEDTHRELARLGRF